MAYSGKPSVDCARGRKTPKLLRGGWRKLLPKAYEGVFGTGGILGASGVTLEGRADPGDPVQQNFAHRSSRHVTHICMPAERQED